MYETSPHTNPENENGDSLLLHPIIGQNLQRPSIANRITRFMEEGCPGSVPEMRDIRNRAASLVCALQKDPAETSFWSSNKVFIKHYLFKAFKKLLY